MQHPKTLGLLVDFRQPTIWLNDAYLATPNVLRGNHLRVDNKR